MERPTKGQRGGSGGNSTGSKRGSTTISNSSGGSNDEASKSKQQREEAQHRGRAVKIALKDDGTRKSSVLTTPASRTRSGSRGSGGASPATLNSRAPHKTATVAPAPPRPAAKALNRFGFRTSGKKTATVKSGESTDSVNSILSDVQTVSDSNSNIFELCDEDEKNSNGSAERSNNSNSGSAGKLSDANDNALSQKTVRLESPLVKGNKSSPPSNGVTKPGSAASQQSGKITAHTRQLPKPQIVTVKSVSPKPQGSRSHSPRLNSSQPSPMVGKSRSPTIRDQTSSPSVRSLVQTPAKLPMNQGSRVRQQVPGSTQSIPRMSRDSESSTKSVPEADSGIGSSSESDRIRGEAAETDTIASSTLESTEDISDVWLRSKQMSQESVIKRRSRNLELNINGAEFELKRPSLEIKGESSVNGDSGSNLPVKSESPPEKRGKVGKDRRDGQITYGMARQKFAPYSRSRYGYGYQSGVGRSNGESTTSTRNMNGQSATQSKIPNSSGLVRTRVAMIETTPSKKVSQQTPVLRRSNVKKPAIRPTSLEKTPLLVMPVTERTVELSKPVCRKLEYSEGTAVKIDDRDETSGDTTQGNCNILKTVAEDILIVGSVETETQKDNILVEAENHGSYYIELGEVYSKVIPESELTTSYIKAKQDLNESEKSNVNRASRDASHSSNLTSTPIDEPESSFSDNTEVGGKHDLQSPDELGLKAITPQSESSFEILESLSETIDLTIEEIKEDTEGSASVSESRSMDEDPLTKVETPTSPEVVNKPSIPPKPRLSQTPPRRQSSSESPSHPLDSHKAQNIKLGTSEKQSLHSPVDKKRQLGQVIASLKSSVESKSSMESSVESQKSLGSGNPMVESGELTATLSGMCTPVLTSKGDMDQDFLIDDEISDQPGLLFAGSGLSSSFFGDDGMFDELASASPGHAALKAVMEMDRSRADSVETASSLGADDLMLDYEDTKLASAGYEEEVLSPDASEIFSEWTAMMAEMGGSERCVSRDGSSCGGGRTPRTRQGSLSDTTSPDTRRHTVLRPPRQGGACEADSGGVYIDRTSYQYLRQEARALKTMLLQLRRVLQGADTLNPFDTNRNSLYLSLGSSTSSSEGSGKSGEEKDTLTQSVTEISHENVDLRRQVVLLQQQLEEKDRTIRLLQQQLSQMLVQPPTDLNPHQQEGSKASTTINAATQTDRSARTTLMGLHASSFDDGSGPTVSTEVDGEKCGRSRSTSLQDHSHLRHPRAASQPPINPTRSLKKSTER